jgi:polyisoprenoid-binding protein YceI
MATKRRRRWPWWLGGGIVVALLLVVGGPFVYIHFIQGNPPPKLTFSNADRATTTTAAAAGTSGAAATTAAPSTDSVDGTWTATSASQAGYRVKEVLFGQDSDAVGRTNKITGQLTIAGTKATAASFTVDMKSVTSDQSQRDRQFQGRIMDTSSFPTATFTLNQPIDFGSLPPDKTEISVRANGKLTLRGMTKDVTVPLTARRNGANIEVAGSIPITFAEWNIPNPSIGPVTTEDHGVIEFLLVFNRA